MFPHNDSNVPNQFGCSFPAPGAKAVNRINQRYAGYVSLSNDIGTECGRSSRAWRKKLKLAASGASK